MAFLAIAHVAINYRDYPNNWIKSYEVGTTTPKAMALKSDGTNQVAKLEVNADGFLISSGNALVIPYIDDLFDMYLFPTEAEADANNTTNAIRIADGSQGESGPNIGVILEKVGVTVVPGQTVYSLTNEMTSQNAVYINGVMQHFTDGAYSIVDGDLVLSEGLTSKDILEVWNRIVVAETPASTTDIDYSFVSIRDLLNTDLSTTPFAIGERIETKGKANEGDGGGSLYEVATVEAVDFTSVIPLNGSVVGKLIRGTGRSRGNNATEVIAHRGFTDFNVEQTMYAFTSALEYGADSLECDIQITSDGEMVLFHDVETEVLLNNITGKVKENTFAATQAATWREFSFGNVLEDKVHLTKFTDLLNYVQQEGCFLHAEIKDYRTRSDIDLIVAAIVELGLEGNVTLHSFFLSDIQYVRSINKDIKVAFLSNTLDGVDFDSIPVTVGFDWIKRDKFAMAALRIEAIDDPLNVPNPIIKEFHDADVEVAAWTLNNAKDIAIARRNNVNAIMCDLPSFRKQPLVRNHGTSI